MTTNPKILEIRKEAFIQARETLGLSAKELGALACISTRQIEQIENGEMGSFYGAQVKYTAAKKVAKLLGLSEQDAFESSVSNVVKTGPEKAQSSLADFNQKQEFTALTKEEVKVNPTKMPFDSTTAQVKLAPQKKFLIGISLLAVIVFSVINLRPLFFEEKPEEIIVVKEEVIETAPAAPTAPAETAPVNPITPPALSSAVVPTTALSSEASAATDISLACPAEEGILSYKQEAPRKSADMVYVQAKTKQTVCVVDGSGKIQNKQFEPGAGASFYGKPPFKVLTMGMAQVDVYFQGVKVRLTNPNVKTLSLEAAEVVTPPPSAPDRTDAQQLR